MSELATEWTSLRKTIFGAKTAPQPATLHATTTALQKKGDPIKQGVGRGQTNAAGDVMEVQRLLKMEPTGEADEKFYKKIEAFQRKNGLSPDGIISPKGETYAFLRYGKKLNATGKNMIAVAPEVAKHSAQVNQAANTLGLSSERINSIIAVESGGKEDANKDKESQYKGLMQMNQTAWNEGVEWLKKNKGIDLSHLDFETNVYKPEYAVLIGGAVFIVKGEYLQKAGVNPSHPDWDALVLMAYNAGQGTIINAISRAGTADIQELMNPERRLFFFPNTSEAKYNEIRNYVVKAKAYEAVVANDAPTPNDNPAPYYKPTPPTPNNDNKPNPHRLPPPPPINNPTTSIKYAIQIYESTESPDMEDIKKMNNYAEPQGFVVGSGIASNEDKYFYWVTDRYWTGEEGKVLVEKIFKKTQAVFPKAKIIELDSNGRKK